MSSRKKIKRHVVEHPLSKYKREYEQDYWYLVQYEDETIGFVPEDEFNKWMKSSG